MNTKLASLLLVTAAPFTLAACDAFGPEIAKIECATTQTECLNEWFEAKFEEQLAFSPLTQTALGRKTDYDQIDDFSAEA